MLDRFVCVAAVAAVAACGSPAKPTASEIRIGDATIVAPARWSVEAHRDHVRFIDPDRLVHVTVVADADANYGKAIAKAWQLDQPGFALAPGTPDEQPDAGAWDAEITIEYQAPVAAHRVAVGTWKRFGDKRFVVLVDGDREAVEHRDADIAILEGSLHLQGMQERTLGARRPLDARALDAFVDRAKAQLQVPGIAIAVIDHGKVIYERTDGVRTLGEPAPVTVDTRFLLASITKPMTTMMEAALVDAKVIDWNTPVTQVMPSFAIGDPEITRQLRLWHMSCACTGMPRQDLEDLFEWDHVTAEQRLAMMRTMKPTTKLGETYQYSNLMVAAGGFIAAHALAPDKPLGPAYAAAMQRYVFDPIGMRSTTLDFATVARGDHATPHGLDIGGATRAMPLEIERGVEPIAPAGGTWTTLRDFERYVMTELGDGVTGEGTRVVSAANMAERRRTRIKSGPTSSYGLGIGIREMSGTRVIAHDGGAMGFGTTMFTLPAERIGIIIFTNVRNGNAKEQLPFNAAVTRRIVELLFAGAAPLADKQLAFYGSLRVTKPHVLAADTTWIAPLVGTYHDPALGDVTIRATPTGAELDAGEWHTAIDREVDPDGAVKLVILDPPFAGTAWLVGPGPSLTLPGFAGYAFTRR